MAKKKSEDTQEQSEATEVQEEEANAETQTEEVEELTDEQVTEQVSQLTGSEESEEVEDSEVQEETQTEETEEQTEEVETEEVQAVIPIIDEEMIKQNPVLRSYIGKPVTDLAPIYQKIVSQFTINSQELSEIKRQMAESSLQDTDYPDPVEKPEEFKQWLKDRDEKIKAAVKAPEPQVDLVAEVSKRLPPNTDVNATIEQWANKNAYKLFDELGNLRPEIQSLYLGNPEIFYHEVTEFQKNDVKEAEDEATLRKAGHKELKQGFKKARKSKKNMPGAEVHTISKDVKLTEEEEMLQRIGVIVQEE